MALSYIFRMDEFTEHPQAIEQLDNEGKWVPMAIKGYNLRQPGGVSGQWWHCEDGAIERIPTLPANALPYKTFSTVYGDGHGFWILRGDATDPPEDETWHHLRFDWDEETLSSSLTNTGTEAVMRCHNPEKRWPGMLLPDIYHGPAYPYEGYGGLTGDLPIFLALIALSMNPNRLPIELPRMMQNGEWGTHGRSHGRSHKRGVIVYVYAVDNNQEELQAYEEGDLGMYYR